jgi:antitoxin (DNA-binding transcriptional repressor) of toxin-antitoxin stability system
MKTATVRDLRNRFSAIAKWIEDGEKVTITRNGTVFATLSPISPKKTHKADWVKRFKQYKAVGRHVSKKETEKFWSDLRD